MKKLQKKDSGLTYPVTLGFVERRIYIIRGFKVMIDSELAELYGIETKGLNRAIKRNIERFPKDFMFQLSKKEYQNLKSQIATSSGDQQNLKCQIGTSSWGGKRKPTYAFTELGVAMLSSVLNSDRAVQINIYIMRAFVKLREIMATNEKVAEKIKELERGQEENTEAILEIAGTLERLLDEGANQKDAIGFVVEE
jgi:phage regulator Rha-like protein